MAFDYKKVIPKTCAYVWTVLIGYFAMKKECR